MYCAGTGKIRAKQTTKGCTLFQRCLDQILSEWVAEENMWTCEYAKWVYVKCTFLEFLVSLIHILILDLLLLTSTHLLWTPPNFPTFLINILILDLILWRHTNSYLLWTLRCAAGHQDCFNRSPGGICMRVCVNTRVDPDSLTFAQRRRQCCRINKS